MQFENFFQISLFVVPFQVTTFVNNFQITVIRNEKSK